MLFIDAGIVKKVNTCNNKQYEICFCANDPVKTCLKNVL